jgi:hypothetical protein
VRPTYFNNGTAAILLKSVFRHSGTALHSGSNLDKEIDVGIGR